ncbi:AAA family ATPase [Agrobacterium sp. CCNWLW71]|uniref:AAA family ATPase n=1 Tax=unclassified Agrobacterium TaxID=2632611 RepID=UPI002FEF5C3E
MSRSKKQSRALQSMRQYVLDSIIIRAIREHSLFAAGGPGFLVLVTPEGYLPSEYRASVFEHLTQEDRFYRSDDVGCILINLKDKSSKFEDDYYQCYKRERVIAVIEKGVELPSVIRLAADLVIDIPPITPDDLKAASRAVLRLPMTDEQAIIALSYPREHLWAAFRPRRSISESMRRLRETPVAAPSNEANQNKMRPASETPMLADMYGYGSAKEWGMQLATDLADWQAGKIDWGDVDKGIVLSGPPGVGKSIFASALAKQCDVLLVASSLGRWQSRGHLGDLLKAMRADFDRARSNAPSIMFIDEIDSFGSRDSFDHDNANYSIQVVNALLECLDGLDGREGVVVVGATNNIDRIDPAIIRAGRLDRHVRIPLPLAPDRIAILSQLMDHCIPISELATLGPLTKGMTGADLAKAVRDGRRLARRNKRQLTLEDLKAGLPEAVKISGDHRWAIAVHEAGHTIVGTQLKYGTYLGTNISDFVRPDLKHQMGGAAHFDIPSVGRRSQQFYLDCVAVMLAGLAAEQLCLGDFSDGAGGGENSDLAVATRIATYAEAKLGMGATFLHSKAESDEELEKIRLYDAGLRARVEKTLADQFERAKDILQRRRRLLELLAAELDTTGFLSPERVVALEKNIAVSIPSESQIV